MIQGSKRVLEIRSGKLEVAEVEHQDKKSDSKQKFFEGIETASNLGFTIALPIAGGAILGYYLDNQLQQSPKFTLSLIFLGLFISLYNLYKLTKRSGED